MTEIETLRARVAELESSITRHVENGNVFERVINERDQRIAELEALCADKNGIIERIKFAKRQAETDKSDLERTLAAKDQRISELEAEDTAIQLLKDKTIVAQGDQLAAQALTIKTMREALENVMKDDDANDILSFDLYDICHKAIALPTPQELEES